ncbi:MAG: hypothetical protein JEZ06_11740 [Anaerolineaceae bacterium]|nr:hypothetical protein [Anaerolineaceae bacterium]
MLDDFRSSSSSSFEDDFSLEDDFEISLESEIAGSPPPRSGFLGMTAPQRFIIAVMLLACICVLGGFCLILTEKVILPLY